MSDTTSIFSVKFEDDGKSYCVKSAVGVVEDSNSLLNVMSALVDDSSEAGGLSFALLSKISKYDGGIDVDAVPVVRLHDGHSNGFYTVKGSAFQRGSRFVVFYVPSFEYSLSAEESVNVEILVDLVLSYLMRNYHAVDGFCSTVSQNTPCADRWNGLDNASNIFKKLVRMSDTNGLFEYLLLSGTDTEKTLTKRFQKDSVFGDTWLEERLKNTGGGVSGSIPQKTEEEQENNTEALEDDSQNGSSFVDQQSENEASD